MLVENYVTQYVDDRFHQKFKNFDFKNFSLQDLEKDQWQNFVAKENPAYLLLSTQIGFQLLENFLINLKLTDENILRKVMVVGEMTRDQKIFCYQLGIGSILPGQVDTLEFQSALNAFLGQRISYQLKYHKLEIDLKTLNAYHEGKLIELTKIELQILCMVILGKDSYVLREGLKQSIWPGSKVDDRTLNTHLSNLRSKLSPYGFQLKTIKHGVMLMLGEPFYQVYV